jgi:serine/threonine-protein kinase
MSDDDLPARIDRYEPLKKLATGGMAEIFLAKQSGLEGFEKVVVLKRILPHLASDEEFVSMFLDEARIAAKLSHPNVVQIYDLGKADNTYYIAMEYVSGRNVQHLITKQQQLGGHLPVEHACRIVAGVCDGLYYAHGRKDYDGKPLNIIHRDISPQNILVSFAGGVKVVDFGIAKASTQLAQTRAGVLKGKYAYMSPEQVRGAKIDHRSDVFAVGLVMYEMLTGVRAFERESSLKTLKAIVQEKPLNPREMNPEIPMEVVKLLSKALEKNPDRRYKSAQEMQLALEDWLESSPKKSNNVRLSRFLYDLFDDELNSAEGTMVVKGVGQVIIPTSQGKDAKPAVEEEVDSKTLTAALVDEEPAVAPAAAPKPAPSARVRDELSARQAPAKTPAKQALRQPTPQPDLDDDDDDDGKTVPGYDLEQLEKDRLAKEARKLANANQTMESDAVEEDEDKTRAGVPMSAPSQPPMAALRESTRERMNRPNSDDARAREMLERIDSMAPSTLNTARPPAAAPTASLPSSPTMAPMPDSLVDEAPLPPPDAITNELVQPPSRAHQASYPPESSLPAPRREDTQPGTDTPDNLMTPMSMVQGSPPPGKPASFKALVALSAMMTGLSLLLFAAGAVAFPGAVPAVEYGVVMVTTTPPQATVTTSDGSWQSPVQLVMPLDGEAREVQILLPGFQAQTKNVVFGAGQNTAELNVVLSPG